MHLALVTLIVEDYDPAIAFFTAILGFELVEDTPATTNDGRAKRWVVVRPPGTETGLLLARADGEHQSAAVGAQAAGRVGFFLDVDDVPATYRRLLDSGVTFVSPPRAEPYGQVAVFLDIAGNPWDLRQAPPRPAPAGTPGAVTDRDLADVVALEQELLDPACRADTTRLRELLHPDFREHGASGTIWTRDALIEDLAAAPEVDVQATDLQAHPITPGSILVTYRTEGVRPALRSSVWVKTVQGPWQVRFHQGTLTTGT